MDPGGGGWLGENALVQASFAARRPSSVPPRDAAVLLVAAGTAFDALTNLDLPRGGSHLSVVPDSPGARGGGAGPGISVPVYGHDGGASDRPARQSILECNRAAGRGSEFLCVHVISVTNELTLRSLNRQARSGWSRRRRIDG